VSKIESEVLGFKLSLQIYITKTTFWKIKKKKNSVIIMTSAFKIVCYICDI